MSKRRTNPALRREVALRLREAIRDKGLTVSKAAELLDVTRQALWLYLNEKCMPGGEVLEKACRIWNLSLDLDGLRVTKESFGPRRQAHSKPEQLDLFRVLEQIRSDQIDTRVIGRVRGFFELRVRIKVAS